jgi:hypothetical protein
MKYELKRIRIWSAIKIGFFVWGLIGFLGGLYMAMMMPLLMKFMETLGPMSEDFGAVGPFALIFLPILYSIMAAVAGTILTAIVAGFYNLISSLMGGLEVTLESEMLHPLDISVSQTPPPANEGGRDSI